METYRTQTNRGQKIRIRKTRIQEFRPSVDSLGIDLGTLRLAALAGVVAVSLAIAPLRAQAIGCLSGAAAGAVAGHVAGHHGVIGAIGGCVVGHHLAAKKKREEQARKWISDYAVAPAGSARQAKDAVRIQALAKKKVDIAVQWEAAQRPAAEPSMANP